MENLEMLIKELVKQPKETAWLEFKENYKDSQMIGEDICALANAAALAGNLLATCWQLAEQGQCGVD